MNETKELFEKWKSTDPGFCHCERHYNESGLPMPDEEVCIRERAWRAYVKKRDEVLAQMVAAGKDVMPKKIRLYEIFEAFEEVRQLDPIPGTKD